MLIHLEVSRPLQMRPWRYRSDIGWRVGWLWFAFGVDRRRMDQLLSGDYEFRQN